PGGDKVGWAAKLQYSGSPQNAAATLSSHFTGKGWQITESTELDSGGVAIIFGKESSTGIAVIDADATNPSVCDIVITVDKFMAVVHLGLAYAQYRLLYERAASVHSVADVIRQHRDEHTCDWLTGACQEAVATGDIAAVLKRFLRLTD
ncbi:MAG: hypothetical protein M1546_04470, partial [Chloroflexi bacterium]|nr:hypothetical protein [Chloroflexota bacterium]